MKTSLLMTVLLIPGICAGQTPADPAAAPHLVRAAGMPLNDGSLPPGTLTVRIVEGAFTRNIPGVAVELDVPGRGTQSVTTGPDGRAQFVHVPVGARVRASAIVEGERLESESFEVPAQSGIRILLVAGGGSASSALSDSAPATSTPLVEASAAVPVAPVPASAPPSSEASGVAVIRAVLATATLSALGFVLFSRRSRR